MTMDNLRWGLEITALGMGLVFALLALLWGLLTLVLRLDRVPAGAPDAVVAPAPVPGADAAQESGAAIDADLLAAITVATLTHKAVLRREAAPVMRSAWPGSQLFASRWVAIGRSRQNRTWQRKGK
jgi:Na+-transporting methylmalonyl-CoA/oxaloacetate decarboxylase gamma subunit